MWPEQSRAVAVSRAYSVSVTCSVAMLWKKLMTGPNRSSPPPVRRHWRGKMGAVSAGATLKLNPVTQETTGCSPCVPTYLSWATSCRGSFPLTLCLWTSGALSGWKVAVLWSKPVTGINIKRKKYCFFYLIFYSSIHLNHLSSIPCRKVIVKTFSNYFYINLKKHKNAIQCVSSSSDPQVSSPGLGTAGLLENCWAESRNMTSSEETDRREIWSGKSRRSKPERGAELWVFSADFCSLTVV